MAEKNGVSERHGEHRTKSAFYGFSKTPKQKICLFACSMMGRLGREGEGGGLAGNRGD